MQHNHKLKTQYPHNINPTSQAVTTLKLLSYNIQAGMRTSSALDYVLGSWKYVFPRRMQEHQQTLNQIADLLRNFDIVALQEVDSGSLRSGFINQIEYLAEGSGLPFCHSQLNRNLGRLGQMSNGLLSRLEPTYISNFQLPGMIPGRGAMMFQFGGSETPLIVINLHLALSARARLQQFEYICDLIQGFHHVILIGDMNCQSDSDEMSELLAKTNLRPTNYNNTFPSWAPKRNIDQILVSPTLDVQKVTVLPVAFSDHLPLAIEVSMPSQLLLS